MILEFFEDGDVELCRIPHLGIKPKTRRYLVLGERHLDLTARGQGIEQPIHVGFVLSVNGQRKAFEIRMAGIAAIGGHDRRVTDIELGVLLMSLNLPEAPTPSSVAALLAVDRTTLTAALRSWSGAGW